MKINNYERGSWTDIMNFIRTSHYLWGYLIISVSTRIGFALKLLNSTKNSEIKEFDEFKIYINNIF